MPAVSSDRFLDALRQSRLLAADLVDAQLRRSAAEGPPEDARELAGRFVRDGLLTPYQAEQLLQGKWGDFVIAGKYKVLGLLGAGGMGQVYLAEHSLMRRRAALKMLPRALTDDAAAVERFLREARAVAALDHPNIVRAYDVDTDDDRYVLVMEYIEGVSLQDLVGRRGPVGPAAAANYVAQAALGLQHAHEAGWVHRDVKPANLLLDRAGGVKVLDLGLARLLEDDANPLTVRHDEQMVLGTADYLAPEQALDSHGVDIRADVYSLGATLYFLLTGKPPFPEGTPAQKVLWHQTRIPRPVGEVRPDVPAALAAVLDRMMAKAPADRYPEPAAVADALAPWAGGAYPPTADLVPSGTGGGASGALSSWASRSGSKLTPRPGGRPAKSAAGDTVPVAAAAAMDTTAAPAATRVVLRRRRWPLAVAGLAAAVVGGVMMLPRPTGTPAPPEPATAAVADPPGEVRSFVGHQGAVEDVEFTPDGKRLVTVSQDATARVWDVATGREFVKFTGHRETVRGLAVLPDNRRVATAGWGGTVRLWDLDTGKELQRYVGHAGEVWSVACDAAGRQLLTAGKDRTVRVWDVETGAEVEQLTGHVGLVTAAVFLPDGKRAVSAGEDRTVRVWDLRTGTVIKGVGVPKPIYRLSLCPNGRRVLFGCGTDFVRWDPDGSDHHTPIPSEEAVEGGVCLPDGRLVLAMLDGTIRVWAVGPDREVHVFRGNGQAVLAVAAAPDGRYVASGGRDKVARLWRVP